MRYKFELKREVEIGRPGVRGHPFVSADGFDRLGCALFATEARHGRIKNLASDRLYLVLNGVGEFTVADETLAVNKGQVVIIPRNTPYDYRAANGSRLEVFLVHAPANIDEADVSLEPAPQPDRPPEPPEHV